MKRDPLLKKFYLTLQGLEEVQSELTLLKNEKRPQLIERINQVREFGDISENSEYNVALEEQSFIEARIEELEVILRGVKIISASAQDSETVTLGSTVRVKINGKSDEFTIVSRVEADPSKKRISDESPVGSALLGAKIGEQVEVATPQGKYRWRIVEIR